MNENSKNRSEKHLNIREFICFMKGKGLAYSKSCSKVVHLQQTLHFGFKTFGCCTYAQTEIERNILK